MFRLPLNIFLTKCQVLGGSAPAEHGGEGAGEEVQPDRGIQEPQEDARQQERHDQRDAEEAQCL